MDENFNNEIAKQVTSAILDKYLSPIISKTTDKFKTLYNEVKLTRKNNTGDFIMKNTVKSKRLSTESSPKDCMIFLKFLF